jgi:hypothetical protein
MEQQQTETNSLRKVQAENMRLKKYIKELEERIKVLESFAKGGTK